MRTTGLMAGASRFAHFAGLARPKTRADDSDDTGDEKDKGGKRSGRAADDDDADDEGDDKGGKRSGRAADDDEGDAGDDKDKSGKRSGRASDDDDDGSEDADDKDKGGKRSRRASDDDDDDDGKDAEDDDEDEMKGKGASAQARRREQARISHILGHKAAAANPVLAVSLACDTRMTRREAVAVLKSQPEAGHNTGGNRHARRDRADRNVQLGSDAGQPSGKQAVTASWSAAFEKAGVKLR